MGILYNTVSICHYKSKGKVPAKNIFEWASEALANNAFKSIDNTSDETSTGWVHIDDYREASFDVPRVVLRDHYLAFSLRHDRRRLPSAVLKAHIERAYDEYLSENPRYKFVPKKMKEEIRETVKDALFTRVMPTPSVYDIVWDTRTGIITLASLSAKTIELFEGLFSKTFEEVQISMIHPIARAESIADEKLKQAIARANKSSRDSYIESVNGNLWLGRDFFLWLMYQTMNDSSKYEVNQPGHFSQGEYFVSYLDDRMVLMNESEEKMQRITVAGPQDNFSEVIAALKKDKNIIEATLYLEKQDNQWKTTLKGDKFHFSSFKSPSVTIEKDNITDRAAEREAVFYERMLLLEQGMQLFDSLYAKFLKERLGQGWTTTEGKISKWLGRG